MIGATIQVPHGSQELYKEVVAAVDRGFGGENPPGLVVHVCGPLGDGFRIDDVWETVEASESFWASRLSPAFQEVGLNVTKPLVWPVWGLDLRESGVA